MRYYKKQTKLFENGKLNDKLVKDMLTSATKSFQDGEIIEARDTLIEIVEAIDDFDREYNI